MKRWWNLTLSMHGPNLKTIAIFGPISWSSNNDPRQIVSNNWIPSSFFWLNEYRILLLDATIKAKQWELGLQLSSYMALTIALKRFQMGTSPKMLQKLAHCAQKRVQIFCLTFPTPSYTPSIKTYYMFT